MIDKNNDRFRPVVLSISGHDPSGGAGIQADIETIDALGCYPVSVITALTVQDTRNIRRVIPQPAEQIREQLCLLLDDFDIGCIKIGLLGSQKTVLLLAKMLSARPEIPIVLDPVLSAGGGFDFSSAQLAQTMATQLLPLARVTTPNRSEARRLSPAGMSLDECGHYLNFQGCGHVLITGADEATARVRNLLYRPDQDATCFEWELLAGSFHGSGCTLASAVAALLASGLDEFEAIREAQHFTWQALQAGFQPGRGQSIPDRLAKPRAR